MRPGHSTAPDKGGLIMQNFTEISFPGLGITLNPSTGFSLGSL